jgi:hypothetical protein
MTAYDVDIRTTPQRVREWGRLRAVAVRRVKPAPLLVRTTAAVAALIAMVSALPVTGMGASGVVRAAAVIAVPAVFVGVLPRTRWVTMHAVVTVLLWVFSSVGLNEPAGPGRVALLAGALYVMHAAATLAAVLPTDAVLAPGVAGRWAARTAAVTVVGLVFGVGGLLATQGLPEVQSMVGPIVGWFVAVGLAGLLAWLLIRRRSGW